MRRSGSSLAIVLSVIALASMLSIALCSTAVFHLDIAASTAARQRARNVAESALEATVRCLTAPTPSPRMPDAPFPQAGDRVTSTCERDSAQVVFGGPGPWASVDNLHQPTARQGPNGEPVPPHSALLFARGQSGNATSILKALIVLPTFPYAIACAGPLTSSGVLQVGADKAAYDTGSVVSNVSVQLDAGSTVAGDVDAAGSVSLAPGVQVLGSVNQNQATVAIPVVAAEGFDCKDVPDLVDVSAASGNLTVNAFSRSNGPLTLNNLTLNNGILYVNGDLTVNAIHGNGAVMVGGKVTVQSVAQISSDDEVALVADGDVTLHGQDPASSTFSGLVSTCGSFYADHITVHGLFVQSDPQGVTRLQDVHVQHHASYSALQIGVTGLGGSGMVPIGAGGWEGLTPSAGIAYAGGGADNSGLAAAKPGTVLEHAGSITHVKEGSSFFVKTVDTTGLSTAYADPRGGYWGIEMNVPNQAVSKFVGPDGNLLTRSQMQPANTYPIDFAIFYISGNDLTAISQGSPQYYQVAIAQSYPDALTMLNTLPSQRLPLGVPQFPAAAKATMLNALDVNNKNSAINELMDAVSVRLRYLQMSNDRYVQETGLTGRTVFTIDINQFIAEPQRIRVLMWQEASP